MCMFGYLKTLDIILPLVSSRNWTGLILLTPTVYERQLCYCDLTAIRANIFLRT